MSNTLKTLNVKLTASTAELESKIKKATRTLRAESRDWSNLANTLSTRMTLPLLAFGGAAIKVAGDVGRFEDSLASVMGGTEAAKRELELLRKEAEKPGLDFQNAVKGSVRLQNVEFSAEQARKTLAAFGNALALAGGTGSDLDGVTLALTQIQSKGKVSAEEINQLAERVPQIRIAMRNAFGTADTEELQKMELSTKQFVEGVVAELEKLPTATSGINNEIVNTGVELKLFLSEIGKDIAEAIDLKGLLETFRNGMKSTIETVKGFDDSTKRMIVNFALMAAAAGPAIKVVGMLRTGYLQTKLIVDNLSLATQTYSQWMKAHTEAVASGSTAVASFSGRTKALAEAWKKLDFATKATTIGLVVAGIAAAVMVFKEFNSQLSETERIQESINAVSLDAEQSIVKERLAAKDLIKTLTDENATRDQKKKALDSLNEISPKYFANLNIEKSSVDEINNSYDTYIDNILKAARAKVSQEKIIELEKQRVKLAKDLERVQSGGGTTWTEDFDLIFSGQRTVGQNIQKQIQEIEKQQKALAGIDAPQSGLLKSLFNNFDFDLPDPKNKKKGGGSDDDSTTKQKDALGELAKAYAKADRELKVYNDTAAAAADKKAALREAINTLLEQGVDPASNQIETLRMRLISLDAQTLTSAGIQAVTIEPMIALTGVMESQVEQVTAAQRAWQRFGETVSEMAAAAGAAMLDAAAAGETSFGKLGKAALKSAADVVRAALMKFVATTIEKTAMASGPFGAILAPAAGAAAGIAFNNIIKGLKIPALAEGAVVTKPTLALIGEAGPEIVAPPQKLPGLATMMGMERQGNNNGNGYIAETRIKGSDLIVMIREAAISEKRRTGNSFILNNQ